MKAYRILIVAHASYILLTAIWPLVDIDSFMAVTGPKHDIWLVKTVGALLIPVALCLFTLLKSNKTFPAIVLGMGTALAFILIDVIYSTKDVISDIYLADAIAEFIFLVGWIIAALKSK